MKKTKITALFMAIVMIMGTLVLPASACTVDEDGNVVPCDKVEKRGYCNMPLLTWYVLKGENKGMYQVENPYYKDPQATKGDNAPGNVGGASSETDDTMASVDDLFKSFVELVAERGCKDIVDYDNLTIEYVGKDGKALGYKTVLNPETRETVHYGPDGKELVDIVDIDWTAENPFATAEYDTSAPSTGPVTTQPPVETAKPEAKHFDDVPENAWYAEAVNALAANGVLKGYDDGLFHPENNVTLGELAVIAYRLATGEEPVGKKGCPPDVYRYGYGLSDHWAAYALESLYSRDRRYIIKWTDRIDEPATRGDAIYTVYKLAAGIKGLGNMTVVPEWDFTWDGWNLDLSGLNFKYTDAELQEKSRIPDIRLDPTLNYGTGMTTIQGIMLAYKYGIVHGVDAAGNCNNLGNLTRAELCQMLYNAGITQFTVKADWTVRSDCRAIHVG